MIPSLMSLCRSRISVAISTCWSRVRFTVCANISMAILRTCSRQNSMDCSAAVGRPFPLFLDFRKLNTSRSTSRANKPPRPTSFHSGKCFLRSASQFRLQTHPASCIQPVMSARWRMKITMLAGRRCVGLLYSCDPVLCNSTFVVVQSESKSQIFIRHRPERMRFHQRA
jgi:hypothetical protein